MVLAKSADTLLLASIKKVAQMREDFFSLEEGFLSRVGVWTKTKKSERRAAKGPRLWVEEGI